MLIGSRKENRRDAAKIMWHIASWNVYQDKIYTPEFEILMYEMVRNGFCRKNRFWGNSILKHEG